MPSRLRGGDRMVAVGALALIVVMFFCKWFGVDVPALILAFVAARNVSTSADAWHTLRGIRWLLLLTVVVSVALVVLRGGGAKTILPSASVAALGSLCTLLLLNRVLISHPFAHAEVKLGAWLGIACCALIALGGLRGLSDESDALAELAQASAHSEAPLVPPL